MRQIGLHLRLIDNLLGVLNKAIAFKLPIFQCFLTIHRTGRLITLTDLEIEQFTQLRQQYNGDLYLHVSYQANACEPYGIHVLRRELGLAHRLGFTHAILHPGSGKWCGDKKKGIRVLTKTLNTLMRSEQALILILENSAHGSLSVGGDITDFAEILNKVDRPESLRFCIDTAHAFVYGYNLADADTQDSFITLLEQHLSIERIALIHLNDTKEACGSLIDQHQVVGQGVIGALALKRFALQPKLKHIPLLLELPLLSEEQEHEAYRLVCSWHESESKESL